MGNLWQTLTEPYAAADPFSSGPSARAYRGFGAVGDPTAIEIAGRDALARAAGKRKTDSGDGSYDNLRNHLDHERHAEAAFQSAIAHYTQKVIAYYQLGTAPVRSSVQHPAKATIVRSFYDRYLRRTGAQVDAAGLDHWVTSMVNGGTAGPEQVERAFRVQAITDHVFTEAQLAAMPPTYFTLQGGTGTGTPIEQAGREALRRAQALPNFAALYATPAGNSEFNNLRNHLDHARHAEFQTHISYFTDKVNTRFGLATGGGGTGVGGGAAGGGIFDNVTDQVNEWADSIGVEPKTLLIGGAVAAVGLYLWANSSGGKRKR